MAEALLPADDPRTLLAAADAARARGAQRLATDLARQALALADTQAPPSAGDADLPALLEGVRQTWLPVAQARGLVLDLRADPTLPDPLPVDELNKCLWISGYCRRMFKRLATLPHGKLQRASEDTRRAA